MPEKRKRTQTCHNCGLEDLDACETRKIHRSSLEVDQLPCRACIRNPESVGWYDFWSEQWTGVLSKGRLTQITIEDPTPHECEILRVLHALVKGGEPIAARV